jgi:hypothetical protein
VGVAVFWWYAQNPLNGRGSPAEHPSKFVAGLLLKQVSTPFGVNM